LAAADETSAAGRDWRVNLRGLVARLAQGAAGPRCSETIGGERWPEESGDRHDAGLEHGKRGYPEDGIGAYEPAEANADVHTSGDTEDAAHRESNSAHIVAVVQARQSGQNGQGDWQRPARRIDVNMREAVHNSNAFISSPTSQAPQGVAEAFVRLDGDRISVHEALGDGAADTKTERATDGAREPRLEHETSHEKRNVGNEEAVLHGVGEERGEGVDSGLRSSAPSRKV
jgi:hypothetical protein